MRSDMQNRICDLWDETLERKEPLEELKRLLVTQSLALDKMTQGLCLYGADQRIVFCNSRFWEMYGLTEEQCAPGTTTEQVCRHRIANGIFGEADPGAYIEERTAPVIEATDKMQTLSDGRTIFIRRRPMPDGGWVTTHEDVTERRNAEERVAHMAMHDGLTGLPNRTLFRGHLDNMLKLVRRGDKAGLLWLDLDHFKNVNDSYGHAVGDALLCEFADRLSNIIRETDVAARLSGDEFAVLQAQVRTPRDCAALAERLIDALSGPYKIHGHLVMVGVSVGVVIAEQGSCDADHLMRNADLALYRAKNEGRGTYRFFEAAMDVQMQARRKLESDLHSALVREEFQLYYQPIMDLKKMAACGFEALIRWNHPEQGNIPPNDFIPVAEETGLIIPMTEWILRQACQDAISWTRPLKVAVNLSPVSFRHGNPADSIAAALEETGLCPSRLEVEITENLLLDKTMCVETKLRDIKKLGVRISMDDFGTGYSSLNYLSKFPFDKIKIDRSFIKELPEETNSLAILRSIAGLGISLGMVTTAEGVETSEQLDIAISEGCSEVQGFYFSAPRPASELTRTLTECEMKCLGFSGSRVPTLRVV